MPLRTVSGGKQYVIIMGERMAFKTVDEAYAKVKEELLKIGYEVSAYKEIQYGIQFLISQHSKEKQILRVFNGKKGVTLDLSQCKDSDYGREVRNCLGMTGDEQHTKSDTQASSGNFISLCIGINEYVESNFVSLNYAVNDARELHEMIIERFGFGDGTVLLTNQDASFRAITQAIQNIIKIARPEDTVLIFVASHGQFSKTSRGADYYIVASDSANDNLISTALPMEVLKGLLSEIKAERKVLFLDTCYSGAISPRDSTRVSEEAKEAVFNSFQTGDFVIITSSLANQKSYECEKLKHGVFSYFILSGLTGAVETKDHGVDLHTLYLYVYSRVRDYASKTLKQNQTPKFFGSFTGEFQLPILKELKLISKKKISDYIKEPLDNKAPKFKFENIRCIGIDESGKGDFFGPLVVAGVYVDTEEKVNQLRAIGVRDCKTVPDDRTRILAQRIKGLCDSEVVLILPPKYNELYGRMGNLNEILAWGHAQSLERLLQRNACDIAISDQFAGKDLLISKLKEHGKTIELIQRPKAEENIAVAAASILARARFLEILEDMERRFNHTFHKGVNQIVKSEAVSFVKKGGNLNEVAKMHFRTTEEILEMAKKQV